MNRVLKVGIFFAIFIFLPTDFEPGLSFRSTSLTRLRDEVHEIPIGRTYLLIRGSSEKHSRLFVKKDARRWRIFSVILLTSPKSMAPAGQA